MPEKTVPIHRRLQRLVNEGILSRDDCERLRDAIISTRETLHVIGPTCEAILDQSDHIVAGLGDNVPGGGCVSVALVNLFGPEVISLSHPIVHLDSDKLPEFTSKLGGVAQSHGMKWEKPTSAADFVALMEVPTTVGALLEQRLSAHEGHVLALRPVMSVENGRGEVQPLTEWGQLFEEDDVTLHPAIAISDASFRRPATKFCSYNLLTALLSSTSQEEPGVMGAIVFQRDPDWHSRS